MKYTMGQLSSNASLSQQISSLKHLFDYMVNLKQIISDLQEIEKNERSKMEEILSSTVEHIVYCKDFYYKNCMDTLIRAASVHGINEYLDIVVQHLQKELSEVEESIRFRIDVIFEGIKQELTPSTTEGL